jgi:hypothetical protein
MLYPFELRTPRVFYGKVGRKTEFAEVVFLNELAERGILQEKIKGPVVEGSGPVTSREVNLSFIFRRR